MSHSKYILIYISGSRFPRSQATSINFKIPRLTGKDPKGDENVNFIMNDTYLYHEWKGLVCSTLY